MELLEINEKESRHKRIAWTKLIFFRKVKIAAAGVVVVVGLFPATTLINCLFIFIV